MDEKNITLIDNLDIQKDDFTVKVRIIRLWSQPLYFSYIHGSKIHANVLQKCIPEFKKLLHEGGAIFIKNPTTARHVSKYKLIDNTNNLIYQNGIVCNNLPGKLLPEFGQSHTLRPSLTVPPILDYMECLCVGLHEINNGA
ncbi:LOW QUALITY PROTEIN: hypothetical protein OSB04_032064, partial [Centaurea solstitialis]